MKILTLDEAGVRFGGKVFRTRVFPAILMFVVFAGVGVGLGVGYWKGEVPIWVMIVFEPILALILLFVFGMIRKGFKSTNWLMVLSPDEVLIKYRSYLNCHMARSDRQVIVLDIDEIVAVRRVKRKEITLGQKNHTQTRYLKFLEIMLAEGLGGEVKEALTFERQAERDYKNPSGKTTTKFGDYPVSVKDENVLRVKMSSVRPGVKGALAWFGANGVELLEEISEEEDFTVTFEDKKQMDDKILTLAMGGKKIAAIKLARRAYGMGLREAKEFVDGLME
jgi:hypothetical protein